MIPDHSPLKTLATGLIGTATSFGAALYSLLPHVEIWLRLSSLAVGLLVACLTAAKLIRDFRK